MDQFEIPLPPNMSTPSTRTASTDCTIHEEPSSTDDPNTPISQSPRTAGPLTKRWFREQFGLRKGGNKNPKIIEPVGERPQRQKGLRRTSSLPDLASMLDAASLKSPKVNTLCRHRSMRESRPVSSICVKH
jgi:hypothetical protein